MYMDKMISVCKAENGFVVECHVPMKPEMEKEGEDTMAGYSVSCGKQYIAKDANEVSALIAKLMPMLDDKFTSEDEFDKAFDEAAK